MAQSPQTETEIALDIFASLMTRKHPSPEDHAEKIAIANRLGGRLLDDIHRIADALERMADEINCNTRPVG